MLAWVLRRLSTKRFMSVLIKCCHEAVRRWPDKPWEFPTIYALGHVSPRPLTKAEKQAIRDAWVTRHGGAG